VATILQSKAHGISVETSAVRWLVSSVSYHWSPLERRKHPSNFAMGVDRAHSSFLVYKEQMECILQGQK